jgi:hypothetical protein
MAELLDAVRSGEVGNDVLDGADHCVYPIHERNVGPLWKAYIGGRVACHIHFVFGGLGQHQSTNLCADFQIFPYTRELNAEYVEPAALQFRAPDGEVCCGDKYWIQHPVFVSVGELLDDSQAVKLRVARSLVGLRIVEHCPVTRRNFAEGIRTGERLATILDREFDAGFVSGLSRASTVAKNELPSELVKGASETVHDVSQQHGYAQPPSIGHNTDAKDIIARLRVELGTELNLMTLPVENGVNLAFESVAVLFRPLNFRTGSIKVDGHG